MDLFLADTLPQNPYSQWVVVALTVATLVYVAVIRPMMKKNRDPLAKPHSFSSLSHQRTTERQMQNLLVELSEMARQISAQLDTRSQKLEMLIQDADERIATLKQLDRLPSVAPLITAKPSAWTEPAPAMTRNIPIPEPADEQHRPVYDLADQGRTAGEIARELDRPHGEIELILALRAPAQRA